MNITAEKLEEYIEILTKDTVIATSYLEVLRELSKYSKEEKYLNIINQSTTFWSLTENSLSNHLFVMISRLYDEHKDVLGLKKLINICDDNQNLFPKTRELAYGSVNIDVKEIIKISRCRYTNIAAEREKLKSIRDRSIVHKEKTFALDKSQLYEQTGLSWENIDELLKVSIIICNNLSQALIGVSTKSSYDGTDDIGILLENAYIGSLYRQEHLMKEWKQRQEMYNQTEDN